MPRILTVMPSKSKQNAVERRSSSHQPGKHKIPLVGAAIFAIVLPLFLILFNTSYITNSEWLYDYGWWRNDIANRTGLPTEQLNRGADQIKYYFNNDEELLDLQVEYAGADVSLYKEREILHMIDVKALMKSVFAITNWSGVVLLFLLAVGLITLKQDVFPLLLRSLKWSAIGTGAFLVVFGGTAVIDFGWLFTQFHFLSFANDLWLLDPYNDYLIIMFPQQFFFEATLFIGLLTVVDFGLITFTARIARRRLG
ncbi:MAG: TIGR01906 family membrane protein [Chloroflexi bacterium]|nr:TIGR01906 family membrane protein [Chloroflexota bacterium]MBT3863705.1 TIGR01906 family membrane protein [Chloroflexota bacterium]MBT4142805.1 TIGR01906 family membrane protein [Chloroflexota bacterium]MBT5892549.1 TIGR01906 family membrane protein [Chloroflexota bacterium]MBT6706554.1 TIGR01906 family membrane protein [Chloroflexota bacterium]